MSVITLAGQVRDSALWKSLMRNKPLSARNIRSKMSWLKKKVLLEIIMLKFCYLFILIKLLEESVEDD